MDVSKVRDQFETFVQHASEEEYNVLSAILTGLQQKQEGNFRTYLSAITDVKSKQLENGDYEISCPIQPLIENPLKMVHGGMTATLIDSTMGGLLISKLPENQSAVTVELKVNYIRPGIGSHLRCVATILHQGKQLSVVEAKVYTDKNHLIATGTGTFFTITKK